MTYQKSRNRIISSIFTDYNSKVPCSSLAKRRIHRKDSLSFTPKSTMHLKTSRSGTERELSINSRLNSQISNGFNSHQRIHNGLRLPRSLSRLRKFAAAPSVLRSENSEALMQRSTCQEVRPPKAMEAVWPLLPQIHPL